MAMKLSARDVSGFKLLFTLSLMYALMAALVYFVFHMKFVTPLGTDAPPDRFSEARAVEHVRVLAEEIDGRQEGRPGLREAARYIKSQLGSMKQRAGSNLRVEVEESQVGGSFNMMFLGHSISLAYRNHTNIVMRISSKDSRDTDPSVLMNAHFDSPVGSPGAGDCGSCVASLLELARLLVDSGWVPPRPVIFLFNGAEELFMLGSHGFMTNHEWRDSIGAFIDVEASGTGGLDLVCQAGPGSWPSRVYAQSAVYPMAHSAAQDVFHVIPGDTDYRMFAEDYGNIPGLDIIFLLGGYYYHTSFDTVDRLVPGSMQARGENLVNILKAFSSSSKLQTASERRSSLVDEYNYKDERAVFFDYLTWFMVYYSSGVAVVLQSIPIALFFFVPFLLHLLDPRLRSWSTIFWDFLKGVLHHAAGILLAVIFPIVFSLVRLFLAHPMSWFAHSYLAFIMFIPCSLLGLLIPRAMQSGFPRSQDISSTSTSEEVLSDEARFWGAFGFYAVLTLAYVVAGLRGGFLTLLHSVFMFLSWIFFCLSVKSFGRQSLRSAMLYVIPLIPCLAYSVYFGGLLTLFLIEKMGMMGAIPPPYGYFLADVVVAAIVGIVTGWCVGPLIPICGRWLASSSILQFLLHLSIITLAISSRFFPYSKDAPKRIVLQHTFVTTAGNQITDSSYDFSVADSNSLEFVFKYAPEVAKALHVGSDILLEPANASTHETWLALFPISRVVTIGKKFPAKSDEILERYRYFPHLSSYKRQKTSGKGSRRVYLELSLGSLEEVWVTVLNITGPLSSWSFVDGELPVPEVANGGPPSYILRLSGNSHENWSFWLEAIDGGDMRVDVAVLDQILVDETKKLKGLFPEWADVITYSSFISSYVF